MEKIETLHLFQPLSDELISLLKRLTPSQWLQQTVARKWNVKDVAAHLLDGNFRRIALHRDQWSLPPDVPVSTNSELTTWLNSLNADWVKATRRLSPAILVDLLESTNTEVINIFRDLDPMAPSVFPVSWAGELESLNWFDIAREYTERWLHQQQIRDAIGDDRLINERFYRPLLDIFFRAWPHTMNGVIVTEGTLLKTVVSGPGGGEWFIRYQNGQWNTVITSDEKPVSITVIEGEFAWKLFSKSIRADAITDKCRISGDLDLGATVLEMVSVMA